MSRQRRQRLNVPTDDRCRDYWIRGLPDNIPEEFIPRIQMPEGIERDTDRVAGACLKVLQDNYGKNVLRNVLYNRLSDRAFDNDDWDRCVSSVAECFAMFLDQAGSRRRPDDLLEEAASRVIEFMAALQIEQFEDLGEELNDDAYDKTKDALRAGLELAEDINEWKRGGNRRRGYDRDDRSSRRDRGGREERDYRGGRGSSRSGYRGNGTADYDDRGGGSRGFDRGGRDDRSKDRNSNMGFNGGGMAAVVALEEKSGRSERSSRRGDNTFGGQAAITTQNTNDLPSEDEFHVDDRSSTYTARAEPTSTARGLMAGFKATNDADKQAQHFPSRTGGRADKKVEAEPAARQWASDNILPHIQNTDERPMDRIEIDENKVAILASLSGLTKTYVFGEPERTVYDSYTHVHYHIVEADGTVSNLYLPLEKYPNMDYAALETNKAAEKSMMKHVAEKPRVAPNYDLLANMVNKNGSYLTSAPIRERSAEEIEAVAGLEELALAHDNVANVSDLPTPVMALTIGHGIALHDASAPLNDEDEGVREYYVDVVTPFISTREFSADLLRVTKCKTLAAAVAEFASLLDNGTVPAQAWFNLHDHLTDRLVSFLNNEMSIRVKFDSIVYDWESVATGIEQRYSKSAMDIINSKVEKIFGDIITPLMGEDLDTFSSSFCELSEGKQITAVGRRVAVSYSNWSSKDLGAGLSAGGVVLESATPQLYKSLVRLLERTEAGMENFAQVLLVATDNKVYDLRRGAFNNSHLILVPVSSSVLQ